MNLGGAEMVPSPDWLKRTVLAGQNRQRPLIESLGKQGQGKIYLFGAGVYAYVLKRYLEACDVQLAGVAVDAGYVTADDFMGLPVLSLDTLAAVRDEVILLVGVTQHQAVCARLKEAGFRRVFPVDVPDYLNIPEPFMTAGFVEDNANALFAAWECLDDEKSRATFIASLQTKLHEDLSFVEPLIEPDHIYFSQGGLGLGGNEVLLDVGGYNGDTLTDFHRQTNGNYRAIISLEPSPENFAALEHTAAALGPQRIFPVPIGAWNAAETLGFAPKQGHIDNQVSAHGADRIQVDRIDNIVHGQLPAITIMKLDINGAEYEALEGSARVIREMRPRIVVRLHKAENYFRIPLLLKKIAPDIKLKVRQRGGMSMMIMLYASFDAPSSTAAPNP